MAVEAQLTDAQHELLYDPQTSGGLLVALAADKARALVEALQATGHRAADIGEVLEGPPRVTVV